VAALRLEDAPDAARARLERGWSAAVGAGPGETSEQPGDALAAPLAAPRSASAPRDAAAVEADRASRVRRAAAPARGQRVRVRRAAPSARALSRAALHSRALDEEAAQALFSVQKVRRRRKPPWLPRLRAAPLLPA
jgi:hypothetical protein